MYLVVLITIKRLPVFCLFKWRVYLTLSHVLGCHRNKTTRLKGLLWFLTLNCEQWRTEKAINTSVCEIFHVTESDEE